MKVLGFAGSNSYDSINRQLVEFTATYFDQDHEVEVLDLLDYEVEIYSKGREERSGIPQKIKDLASKVSSADLLIVSLAENNSSYNAGFKNIYDWMSRMSDRKVWGGKDMVLMATSPGGGGGKFVLQAAEGRFPRDGAELKVVFSLPKFNETFDTEVGKIVDEAKLKELEKGIDGMLD